VPDEEVARIPPPRATCGECEGGFVEVESGGVMPCATCNPEAFARWAEGAYRPSFEDKPMRRYDGDTTFKDRRDLDL
jgi:ribosomal protein L37AE/L43A